MWRRFIIWNHQRNDLYRLSKKNLKKNWINLKFENGKYKSKDTRKYFEYLKIKKLFYQNFDFNFLKLKMIKIL